MNILWWHWVPVKPATQLHCPVKASQLPSPFLQSHVSPQSGPQLPASHTATETSCPTWAAHPLLVTEEDQSCSRVITIVFQHVYLSCTWVQSSRERSYNDHSQGHSERCSHRRTSFGILDRNVHSGTLQTKKKRSHDSLAFTIRSSSEALRAKDYLKWCICYFKLNTSEVVFGWKLMTSGKNSWQKHWHPPQPGYFLMHVAMETKQGRGGYSQFWQSLPMNPEGQIHDPLCLWHTPPFSQTGQVCVQPEPQKPSGHTRRKDVHVFIIIT